MSEFLMLIGLLILALIFDAPGDGPNLDAPLWLPLVIIALGVALRAVALMKGAKDE